MDHKTIESKWRKIWKEKGVYRAKLQSRAKSRGKKFYNLMMFPYPSAEGLHVGNMYAFTGADVYGRFQAMRGYDVFEPIGLDGFGIHSENYAIKIGIHPMDQAKISEKRFYDQLSRIGNRFSWEQRLETYDPEYYQWTQWLFVQMWKAGLAYRKKASVNWCPSCKTVLADEQVLVRMPSISSSLSLRAEGLSERSESKDNLGGVCERCSTVVEKRETEQWFFRITEYADRLLDNLKKIDWPKKITIAQEQWIGKSRGLSIDFTVKGVKRPITIWTKFWETVFGTTYLVLAPEHWSVELLQVPNLNKKAVDDYVKMAKNKSDQERLAGAGDKTGVFTGVMATNPVNGESVPVWIADYVLKDVGTGAVMGVPAHDERDFAFAKKFKLGIIQVVNYPDKKIDEQVKNQEISYEGEGKLVNSGEFDGLDAWGEGKAKMAEWIISKKFARWETNYHLRDWLISRQRYWGPPIPMIFCEKCQWQAEKEANLPVVLPYLKNFKPTDDGRPPLERAEKSWLYTKCPKCGGQAKRETEVSDTFLDSSWYFLRYPSISSEESPRRAPARRLLVGQPFDPEITKRWLPVDAYIGGAEHAVLHLLYSRFVWMALRDWGYLPKKLGDEPFPFLYGHGLIIKDGAKMSKSRGNVVIPDKYIDRYGADALRLYLMFIGPYDQGGDFSDTGMRGMSRFLARIEKLVNSPRGEAKHSTPGWNRLQHQTVKRVTQAMKNLRYNVALAALMEYVNGLEKYFTSEVKEVPTSEVFKSLILMLAPFAPYVSEELWEKLGGKFSVHQQPWPKFEERLATNTTSFVVVQVNGKYRGGLEVKPGEAKNKALMIKRARFCANVAKHLIGKTIIKAVFVPGRLVNLVVK
ncbi:leucine--tRNA ligase [Candidatus Beckwithbacteria bacterium RIFCSPHIGHO2_12_FULL_47_17]|uniref:Leucine--tRNA ligase n=1 Tax=Candidatus Beckwithbacteria bacterium RIFCSPHIGHO2_12_FULL_47_17 TaxID=1797460 RepID=A0A1F5DNL1_9BACT|nr:MAG: leucine--tRNA ligase [Candidatus Beckwithbacteria bacterium RIFCSPHIGHO2_12_FULL_47_17]